MPETRRPYRYYRYRQYIAFPSISKTGQYSDKINRDCTELIEFGMLLGKYVPVEMLVQMPLPFVHCLRDIRLKQLEEQKRKQDIASAQMHRTMNSGNNPQQHQPKMPSFSGIDDSALDDLVDELAGV